MEKQVLAGAGDDADHDIDHDDVDSDIAACWEGSVVVDSSLGRGRGSGRGRWFWGLWGGLQEGRREQRQKQRYKVTRRYYTSHRRFEQSLDIYEPSLVDDRRSQNDGSSYNDIHRKQQQQQQRPHIVVLVMGSGWLGHRSFVYSGTNWWNSSAPKNIVSCGQVAICVRHSGGFPIVGTTLRAIVAFLIILWIVYQQLLSLIMTEQTQQYDWYTILWNASTSYYFYVVFALVTYIFLHVQSSYGQHRPAKIQQMVDDVSKALSYIDEHIITSKLLVLHQQDISKNDDSNKTKIPIIFGGYSSGGHVAATLLLSPTKSPLPKRKLQPPSTSKLNSSVVQNNSNNSSISSSSSSKSKRSAIEIIPSKLKNIEIEHVLLLSGVLDVSEEDDVMTLVCLTALNEWPENVPSPLRMLQQRLHIMTKQIQQQQQQQRQKSENINDTSSSSSSSSSIYYPILPRHTLIGCRYEVMGVPILRPSFCSTEYASTLRNISQSNDHQCHLLEGSTFPLSVNHWTILNSNELHETLRTKVFNIDKKEDKYKFNKEKES